MTELAYLKNFPFDTVEFLKKLYQNNNKEWFESHRNEYEEKLLKPAQAFVIELGKKLAKSHPHINAIPKIDKSIFRIYRDVRFSKDKRPYKTNMGLILWEGPAKKMESSGLYFHVDPNELFVATGMYQFSKPQLTHYREIIGSEKKGAQLSKIVKEITSKGYSLGGKTYKKAPTGIDKEYKYLDLALHSGIYAFKQTSPDILKGKDPVEYANSVFSDLSELHNWLLKNMF